MYIIHYVLCNMLCFVFYNTNIDYITYQKKLRIIFPWRWNKILEGYSSKC